MNAKKEFSSSNLNSMNYFTNQDKIELLECNSGSQNCKEHLLIINKCYIEANSYHLNKDFMNSIESLKSAFSCASGLQQATCLKCAHFFRSTITNSLENIHGELERLTTGLISNNRYLKSYRKSCAVLNEIKNEMQKQNL